MKAILNLLFCALLLNISGCSNAQKPEYKRTIWSAYCMKYVGYDNGKDKVILYYDSLKVTVLREPPVRYKNPERFTFEAINIYGNKVELFSEDSAIVMFDAFKTPANCFLRYYNEPIEDWIEIDEKEAAEIAPNITGLHYFDEDSYKYADSVIKSKNLVKQHKSPFTLQVIINGSAYGYLPDGYYRNREVVPYFRNN